MERCANRTDLDTSHPPPQSDFETFAGLVLALALAVGAALMVLSVV